MFVPPPNSQPHDGVRGARFLPPDFEDTPFYRPPIPEKDYLLGLDLAQVQDFSALVVVERCVHPDDRTTYDVVGLKRWERGTRYTKIVEDLAALLGGPKLPGAQLVADVTGVGRGVWEMLTGAGLQVVPITITAGRGWTFQQSEYRCSKLALVATLQALLSSRRLRVAKGDPLSATLVQELLDFRTRITPHANETFASWRESGGDDLTLALACCCWYAEKTPRYTGDASPILLTPGGSGGRPAEAGWWAP